MFEDQEREKLLFSRFSDEQLEELLRYDVHYNLFTSEQVLTILEILEERNPLTPEEKLHMEAVAEECWQKALASYELWLEQGNEASDHDIAFETESMQPGPRSSSPKSTSFSWVSICFSEDVK